jgi:hypothetical protein
MIIWGGLNFTSGRLNTGGRYDPVTDSWISTSLDNAPSPRDYHSAVWTGTEMIIWGGASWAGNDRVFLNTGKPLTGNALQHFSVRWEFFYKHQEPLNGFLRFVTRQAAPDEIDFLQFPRL